MPFSATPDALFTHAGMLALVGWIVLAAGTAFRLRGLRDVVAGRAIPALLSIAYTAILFAHWSGGDGDFNSLAGVADLFRDPWLLLAGWIHYLAFDLFVGAWIARDAERLGLSRLLLIPVLPATFLFGPAGFLSWICLRAALRDIPRRSLGTGPFSQNERSS